ncbi:biosynthetic peptidoglycan transglycosylase-like [Phoenix dactylifera]|uniref:Biosynthetic peptidoglycan transglycosylase-like n=1 Tax=Phoenix dactylifera TaxID=42345 RepID=A0A8B7CE45_PHODC|nr:biosynthetic peptidoglycan transglycosylase-like [Phoenix dactylifera]
MLSIRNLNKVRNQVTAMPLLAAAHQVLVTAGPLSPTTHLRSLQPQSTASFAFLSCEPKAKPRRCRSLSCSLLPSLGRWRPSRSPVGSPNPLHFLLDGSLSLCSHLGILPPDFPDRWRHLLAVSEEAESRLSGIPYHLIQAITASEDRRFFYHSGVDPHGIARAVFNFPSGGGGSTITQQLMKRIFLTSERKISRKFVEGLLSLIVEKKMSKWKILYSYLSKMYWGHGLYGIESASIFYFGKHPSFLTLGESALLAGILPGPELLSPYRNPGSGKSSQARVLRRMVAAGFLDMETALKIAKQPLCLRSENETSEDTGINMNSLCMHGQPLFLSSEAKNRMEQHDGR